MVKLHQCFLLIALGLASAASAAAIAKGDEQALNLERRFVDTKQAPSLAPRNGEGNSHGGRGGNFGPPPSPGQGPGGGGDHGRHRAIRRRSPGHDNGSQQNSGNGIDNPSIHQSEQQGPGNGGPGRSSLQENAAKGNAPRRSPSTEDAVEIDPATAKQQLQTIINADADQQMAEFFSTYGHCAGPESATCQHHSCLLESSDCIPFGAKEKLELSAQTKQVLFKVATTGTCKRSRATTDFCSKADYCDYFDLLGIADDAGNAVCNRLDKQQYAVLISKLRPQPDGSFEVVDNDNDANDKEDDNSDKGVKGGSPYETQFKMVKRAICHTSESVSDEDDDHTVDFLGMKLAQERVKQIAAHDAKETLDAIQVQGYCEEGSTTCHTNPCDPSTPGCIYLSDADKAKSLEKLTPIVTRIYLSGKCEQTNTRNCDSEGSCKLRLENGDRDPSCIPLTQDELSSRLEAEGQQFSSSTDSDAHKSAEHSGDEPSSVLNRRAPLKAKRDAPVPAASSDDDNDKIIFFGGVKLNQTELAQKVVDYASQATRVTSETSGHFSAAELSAIEAKFRIAYTQTFFFGSCDPAVGQKDGKCDHSSRCHMWSADAKRDLDCRSLSKRQTLERLGAILHHLSGSDDAQAAQPGKEAGADHGNPSAETVNDHTVEFLGARVNQMQMAQQVTGYATKQMSLVTQTQGRCDTDSDTCFRHVCDLKIEGCRSYSEEEAASLEAKLQIAFAMVLYSGTCDPKAGQKDGSCDSKGRCQLWSVDGQPDAACKTLAGKDILAIFSEVLINLPGDIVLQGAQQAQAAASGNAKGKRDIHFIKRALLDDDVDSFTAKVKRHVSLSSSSDSSNDADTALLLGHRLTEEQMSQTAIRIAKQAMEDDVKNTGLCDRHSSTCRDLYCEVGTPGCVALSDTDREELQQALTVVIFEVFSSGTCDATTKHAHDSCDKNGQCYLWFKNGKRDHTCKEQTEPQLREMLEGALSSLFEPLSDGEDASFGAEQQQSPDKANVRGKVDNKMQKRHAELDERALFDEALDVSSRVERRHVDDNTAVFSGQPLTEVQIAQVADQAATGIVENDRTDSEAVKPRYHKLFSDMIFSVYSSGKCDAMDASTDKCDKWGRCHLWLHGKRDHGCKELADDELRSRLEAAADALVIPDYEKEGASSGAGHGASDEMAGDEVDTKKQKRDVHLVKRALLESFAKVKRDSSSLADVDLDTLPLRSMSREQLALEADRLASLIVDQSEAGPQCAQYPSICREIQQTISATIFSVFSSGWCDAAVSSSDKCDKAGQCRLWSENGKRANGCKRLTDAQMGSRLEAALKALDDSVSGDKVSSEKGSGETTAGDKVDDNKMQKRHVHLLKRALADDEAHAIASLLKRQNRPSTTTSSLSSPEDSANLVKFNGTWVSQQYLIDTAGKIANISANYVFNKYGECDPSVTTCSKCPLHIPGCKPAPHEEQVAFRELMTNLLVEALMTGNCDANRVTADTKGGECDTSGQCYLWTSTGDTNPGCTALTEDQIVPRAQELMEKQNVASEAEGADGPQTATGDKVKDDKMQKRDLTRRLLKRSLLERSAGQALFKRLESSLNEDGSESSTKPGYVTVPVSSLTSESDLYQPTPQETWELQKLCSEISSNHEALEQVAHAAGVQDEADVVRLGQHFAMLAENREEAVKSIRQAKMAQMVAESKVGDDSEDARASVGMAQAVEKLRDDRPGSPDGA